MVSLMLTFNKYTTLRVLSFSIHHFYGSIYNQSEWTQVCIRKFGKKWALERKPQMKNTPFYWKVCRILGKILYSICKYFIMWDIQPHSISWLSRNNPESGCLQQALNACTSRKRKGKTPQQICFISYCEWALMKFQQENTLKHYNYLKEVLNYICVLVPNNIKGEILEDLLMFNWKNSVKLCKLSYCNNSLVVTFWRFIGRSLQQKFPFQ